MVIRKVPDEIAELEKVFKPFMIHCRLVNPTPEALEAFEKVKDWYWEQGQ